MKILTLTEEGLSIAIDWAAKEGWNPGLHDASTFYAADPTGFFAGTWKDEVIAVGSSVNYDPSYAFLGLYIVKPGFRGLGYGMAIWKHMIAHAGMRNIGLDGVLQNVHLYERTGFTYYYKNYRYEHVGQAQDAVNDAIVALDMQGFDQLSRYDRQCFPAPRDAFLQAWISQPDAKVLGFVEQGQLRGYGVCRRCLQGYKIGPLFADDTMIAQALFSALQQSFVGEKCYLDVPEINEEAMRLASRYGMKEVFATARMYSHRQPSIADDKVFGVTTFELG